MADSIAALAGTAASKRAACCQQAAYSERLPASPPTREQG
jgi:hypothetical protein